MQIPNRTLLINSILENRPIKHSVYLILHKILAIFSVAKIIKKKSGVVITGYGEDEILPSLFSYNIQKVINKKLSYATNPETIISDRNSASIIPFAHSYEVETFMNGISTQLNSDLNSYLLDMLTKHLPENLNKELGAMFQYDKEKSKKILKSLQETGKGMFETFANNMKNYVISNNSSPVVTTVSFLSVSDMAVMAETLVNLESFRKKVTFSEETVGGEIDVAVITKGDGFIWIKRKHYFKPDLNHQFFNNYFRKEKTNER